MEIDFVPFRVVRASMLCASIDQEWLVVVYLTKVEYLTYLSALTAASEEDVNHSTACLMTDNLITEETARQSLQGSWELIKLRNVVTSQGNNKSKHHYRSVQIYFEVERNEWKNTKKGPLL